MKTSAQAHRFNNVREEHRFSIWCDVRNFDSRAICPGCERSLLWVSNVGGTFVFVQGGHALCEFVVWQEAWDDVKGGKPEFVKEGIARREGMFVNRMQSNNELPRS